MSNINDDLYHNAPELNGSVHELIKELQKNDGVPVQFEINRADWNVHPSELASALRDCSRNIRVNFHWLSFAYIDDSASFNILDALAENSRFHEWNLSYHPIGTAFGLAVAERLMQKKHVVGLQINIDGMGEDTVVKIVEALKQQNQVRTLTIFGKQRMSSEIVTVLATVRAKFPCAKVAGDGRNGQILSYRIAMVAIKNPAAEATIRNDQRRILDAFTIGDLAQVMLIMKKVRQAAIDEERRLLELLPLLIDKYSLIGGFTLLKVLPDDFDTMVGRDATGQFLPEPLRAMHRESQVNYLLGIACYKDKVLRDICTDLEKKMEELLTKEMDDGVDALFENWELSSLAYNLEGYEVKLADGQTSPGSDSKFVPLVIGNYELFGYASGFPYFRRWGSKEWSGDPNTWWHLGSADDDCYLYRRNDATWWQFSCELGAYLSHIWLNDEEQGKQRPLPVVQDGDTQGWTKGPLVISTKDHEVQLKRAVLEFLKKRGKDIKDLVSRQDRLVSVKFGPPKALARALEKGPDWLLDLNRCTLTFDSPAIMVLCFHLLKRHVEILGGQITRMNNYFLRDGPPVAAMKQPPCIHMNVRIDGWTFEFMLTLADFAEVKERVHQFYEISRAREPGTLLRPVFDPGNLADLPESLARDVAETLHEPFSSSPQKYSAGCGVNAVWRR